MQNPLCANGQPALGFKKKKEGEKESKPGAQDDSVLLSIFWFDLKQSELENLKRSTWKESVRGGAFKLQIKVKTGWLINDDVGWRLCFVVAKNLMKSFYGT